MWRRRSSTVRATVQPDFPENSNMNPLYEGMAQFENPLYSAPVDDAYSNAFNNAPAEMDFDADEVNGRIDTVYV
jgi:hypothetical protein